MTTIERLKNIYTRQITTSLQNPRPSRTYSQTLRQTEPDISSFGFGCTDLFPFLKADEIHQKRILDFGCGAGSDLALIAKKFQPQEALGIDICPEMITAANQLFQRHNLNNVTALAGSLADLPTNTEPFDFIISNAVIHLNPNKNAIFTELFRLSNEKGMLLIADFATNKPLPSKLAAQYQNSDGLFLFGGLETLACYESGLAAAGFEEIEKLQLFHFDPREEIARLLHLNQKPKTVRRILQELNSITFHVVIYKIRKKADWLKIESFCPNCHKPNSNFLLQNVNRQIQQKIADQLLRGEINFPICTHCQYRYNPLQFQYHDMQKKIMAFVFPSTLSKQKEPIQKSIKINYEAQLPPDYQLYCCFNLDEFISAVG